MMDELERYKTYKIGDAASLLGVKSSVLRFWEEEFPQIQPIRTSSGQRLYTEEHLRLLLRVKRLLYDEGLTIEGAKRRLDETTQNVGLLASIRMELEDIRRLLTTPAA